MKACYFNDTSILDAKEHRYQLLKKDTRYNVGNGKTIRMGIDNIINSHPPRPLTTDITNKELPLSHPISSNDLFFWDPGKISNYVNLDDHDYLHPFISHESKSQTNWSGITTPLETIPFGLDTGYYHDPDEVHALPSIPHGLIELKTESENCLSFQISNISFAPKKKNISFGKLYLGL